MAGILIVEDSCTQAVEIAMRLEDAGYETVSAGDGVAALEQVQQNVPEVILTDLHMPRMDGLELVEAIRQRWPQVPVILMTADGTEEIAVEALRRGASHYIPKRLFDRDLLPTLASVVKMLRSRQQQQQVIGALVEATSVFTFGNDHEFISCLVSHMDSELKRYQVCDSTGVFRLTLALKEAVINAIDHGNLELCSDLRDGTGDEYLELGEQRRLTTPYRDRRVTVTSRISPEQVVFTVRDEGPGFDPATIPDPRDPCNMLRAHGRGLMLIQSFMDEVSFNPNGTEITMIKSTSAPLTDPLTTSA